ncbi:MAG: N-acetyltransferase [Bacteroidetes bacterium HGW-Bacteroidetes-1]|jgi:GNAT superfamily N-acetyltransferase|nr:MAG: N-acetyltransferase [Bacteroidetes bacterium HGW-Bacteroidetes-1]
MASINYRSEVLSSDPDTIERLIRSSGFFYENEIPVARSLAEETLQQGEKSGYKFIFAEQDGKTVGYAAYGFVDGTDATYDLYWIAVDDSLRGKGIGKGILLKLIQSLKEENARHLIAETSSLKKYDPTRNFYLKTGFVQQAVLPDFYRLGDDKIFFVLKLNSLTPANS